MDNQNKNDTDKAIIKLGNIFKVFALIATILIIALAVYLFSNAEPPRQAANQPLVNMSNSTCGSFVL